LQDHATHSLTPTQHAAFTFPLKTALHLSGLNYFYVREKYSANNNG